MRGLSRWMVLACASVATSATAQAPMTLELEAPALAAGDRAEIVLRVRGAGPHPVLVTPRSEGTAVEVVRGRMMRAEASDPRAQVLEFRIPVVARVAGAAVIRVRVVGYACDARCRPVHAEASQVIHVAQPAPSP